jgi:superfamily I DNA/RNA helicase
MLTPRNFKNAGFTIYEIKRAAAEQRDKPGARVATMHRVKGLEFEHVIVAAANKGIVPLDAAVKMLRVHPVWRRF